MNLQLAKGVRDFTPEEKILRNKIEKILKDIFERYGFAPLETPIIERYETLVAKFGAGATSDISNETFKLIDQGKRKLGLRFELTTSLARYIGMNPSIKFPFKRYEIGQVFRDGPIKLGRYRSFYQCDIDIIGTKSMMAEAEVLAVAQDIFNKLNLDVIIKINNRKILNGILEEVGVKKKEDVIISIDKLDKIGQKGVAEELKEKEINEDKIQKLFNYIKEGITLLELKKLIKNKEAIEGIEELEELFDLLKIMKVNKVEFDVSLARGLGYYTGPIYEVFLKNDEFTSSLAGGGRWDKMIGNFLEGQRDIPAVGIAFGFEPIIDMLMRNKKFEEKTPAKIYVIPIKTQKEALEIAQNLRDKKINVSIDLMNKGVSKNLAYANSNGIPYVIIVGENELKENKVILRDMKTGNELKLTLSEVVKKLK